MAPDCCAYYWHGLQDEDDSKPWQKFGGGSVMIEIDLITQTFTRMLETALLPFVDIYLMYEDSSFQARQCFDSHSKAYVTKKLLADKYIPVLTWPGVQPRSEPLGDPCTPGLWKTIGKRNLYKNARTKTTNRIYDPLKTDSA